MICSIRNLIFISMLFVGAAFAAVNHPFPQSIIYDNGIELSDKATAAAQLNTAFSYYLATFYNESGNYAGIRSNEGSNEYFSEGIGYGMLMMVYFSNITTSYQSQFDKLWAFYKASEDTNGLMNWKMGNVSPTTVWGENAATDAEMDVAAALILAAEQFGDDTYLTEAKTLLANIRTHEFETNGLHKPGDVWNSKRNPSYIAPAYYELFKNVDTDGAAFWSTTAMNANLTLLEANSAQYSNGLFDNWADDAGTGLDGYYGYDAARAPWRLALSYYWFGNTRTQAMLSKLGDWVATKTASSVSGSISRSSGALGSDHNSAFVATLMTALVTNSAYQSKLDEFWAEAVNLGNENYFNQSLKILCGLAVSGNMPDFTAKSSSIPQHASRNTALGASLQGSTLAVTAANAGVISAELLNLSGRNVKELYRGSAAGGLRLSLTGFHGVYLVRVRQGTEQIFKTIAIQ